MADENNDGNSDAVKPGFTSGSEDSDGKSEKRLLLGIDLGTSRTAVSTSRGGKEMIRSVVGYPRDLIGVKLLGAPYVVGQKAFEMRSYLDLRYPLADGVLREYGERDLEVARHLLAHAIELAGAEPGDEVCAIIGVPARASSANKALLLKMAREVMDTALVVSEPFMVAYGQEKLVNSIVIDIGAGTVDICALKGMIPGADDQMTLTRAGNFVDDRLQAGIQERYPDVQINANIACMVKETHSFVGAGEGAVTVELRAGGKPGTFDVADEIRVSCEAIVPDIVESVETLIQGFSPEDQDTVVKNIILAGGGSRIRGLGDFLAARLSDFGEIVVTQVPDPLFDGSMGALKLAEELPPKYWDQLGDMISG